MRLGRWGDTDWITRQACPADVFLAEGQLAINKLTRGAERREELKGPPRPLETTTTTTKTRVEMAGKISSGYFLFLGGGIRF